MRKLLTVISVAILLFSCEQEKEENKLHITLDADNLNSLDMHTTFGQDELQDLTGLSEQDSLNVNYEIDGKTVTFSLINHGKNTIFIGKDNASENAAPVTPSSTYHLEGTKYENLTMLTISLHDEQELKSGDKYEFEVEFNEFGNYLVGFLYHMENAGPAIMNIRWKYSEIIDLN